LDRVPNPLAAPFTEAHEHHRYRLPRSFHIIIAAQFCSALADNALLIVCVALLLDQGSPAWWAPLLKFTFTIAYVVLAPGVGAWADAVRKGRMMMAMNLVKVAGLVLLLLGTNPLLAMVLVGVGAAAYAPAKYGLVTELVPARGLVAANGWIEVTTVCAVVMGTMLGGFLISPWVRDAGAAWLPGASTLTFSLVSLLLLYGLAAALNLGIPHSGAHYPGNTLRLRPMVSGFVQAQRRLWADPKGAVSMAVTTLFWGAAAVLQFAVLRWGVDVLQLGLDKAAYLQGAVAVGIVIGAGLAARHVSLDGALRVLPLGLLMGLSVPLAAQLSTWWLALPAMAFVGALGGALVVPLNALLQHRGHVLLTAGRSIAVQNFNESASVLVMLGVYAALLAWGVDVRTVMAGLGLLVGTSVSALWWHSRRLR
jgi:MFS family permease